MAVNRNQSSVKAIFLDIDGTLILRDRGPFDEDIEQIQAARDQGHLVFLSSGRAFANIPLVLRNASYIDGIAAGSGAHVVFKGRTIYRKNIAAELLPAICGYYLDSNKWCVFEGETDLYGVNAYDPLLFAGDILAINEKNDFLTKYNGAVLTKLTIEGHVGDEERQILQDNFQLNPFLDYFEGIIKGESKSKAMEIMLNAAGIPRENSIAIGDSYNDIGAVRFAGLGIAMGNACAELKQIAGKITGDCGHGGVGNAIRQWVLAVCKV
ncbi:MAG: Cof-type HAD-IIB family hydrolase [Treponema sp.]|jgi:Cof subfamily protein (haloacid dehalogenase superfamily)|nr:Cof-type HAD-IIB family hydrolase [Treponema sp.]